LQSSITYKLFVEKLQSSLLRGTEQKEKISVGPKEKVFYDNTGEQTYQKRCGISILGNFEKSTEQDPKEPDRNLKSALF